MWRGDNKQGSFLGNQLYEQIVPRDHFLVRLNSIIDWDKVSKPFEAAYKGGGEYGRPAWKPSVMLKMLFLSHAYKLSETQTEEFVNYYLPAKEFLGLEVQEAAPDNTSLSVFKNRVLTKLKDVPFQKAFDEVLRQAHEQGVKFGKVQIVDSVHSIADVDVKEDEKRQNKEGKPPRDPDATWGCKGEKKVKLPDGKIEKRPDFFYGYKAHVSFNHVTRLVTSIYATTGKESDGKYLQHLIGLDIYKGIKPKIVTADRGYDDIDNHMYLQNEKRAIIPAIRIKKNRLEAKGKQRLHWEAVVNHPWYRKALSFRYEIEQVFGILKRWYGFARCRGQGLAKYSIQAYMSFMAYNMKQTLNLLKA